MRTANVREFEGAELLVSTMEEQGSTSTVVAMVGCMFSLVVMLWA